ncbi:MAG: hypothetical protein ACOH10_03280 [Rhodoglobus sp.]
MVTQVGVGAGTEYTDCVVDVAVLVTQLLVPTRAVMVKVATTDCPCMADIGPTSWVAAHRVTAELGLGLAAPEGMAGGEATVPGVLRGVVPQFDEPVVQSHSVTLAARVALVWVTPMENVIGADPVFDTVIGLMTIGLDWAVVNMYVVLSVEKLPAVMPNVAAEAVVLTVAAADQ